MKTISGLVMLAGIVTTASSFFVKDNAKAVTRRWWGVGLMAGAVVTASVSQAILKKG